MATVLISPTNVRVPLTDGYTDPILSKVGQSSPSDGDYLSVDQYMKCSVDLALHVDGFVVDPGWTITSAKLKFRLKAPNPSYFTDEEDCYFFVADQGSLYQDTWFFPTNSFVTYEIDISSPGTVDWDTLEFYGEAHWIGGGACSIWMNKTSFHWATDPVVAVTVLGTGSVQFDSADIAHTGPLTWRDVTKSGVDFEIQRNTVAGVSDSLQVRLKNAGRLTAATADFVSNAGLNTRLRLEGRVADVLTGYDYDDGVGGDEQLSVSFTPSNWLEGLDWSWVVLEIVNTEPDPGDVELIPAEIRPNTDIHLVGDQILDTWKFMEYFQAIDSQVTLVSADPNDVRVIVIIGNGTSGDVMIEHVTLNGTTPVQSLQTFHYISEVYFLGAQ